MTSFPTLTLLFVQKYSCPYNKKKNTRWLEDMNLFSRGKKTIFYSLAAFFRKILFLPLKNKIHIFAPPCKILNILYLESHVDRVLARAQILGSNYFFEFLDIPLFACGFHFAFYQFRQILFP